MVTFLSVFFPSISFFSWSFYSLPFFLLYFAYPCLFLNSVFWQSFFFFVRCWFNFCACLLTCFWIYLNCFSSTKSIMLRLWVTYFCQNVELVGHFFSLFAYVFRGKWCWVVIVVNDLNCLPSDIPLKPDTKHNKACSQWQGPATRIRQTKTVDMVSRWTLTWRRWP